MGVLPPLSVLLLVAIATAAGASGAGAEDALIRPIAGSNVVLGETLCCPNMTEYNECVEACFAFYPREDAEKFCDRGCKEAYQCDTVSGDKCPSPSPSSHQSSPDHLVTDSAVAEEVLVKVQAGESSVGTLCCSNMTGFHECVEACFAYFPREDAVKFCDPGCKEAYQCQTVSGDECPVVSGHPSSSHDSSSAKGNGAVHHCILGCNSTVCNKMITGVGRKGAVKHALERCNNACYKFCKKRQGVRAGTSLRLLRNWSKLAS